MSNDVTILCRPLRMTAPQKAVLMCIADRADDQGLAWPSIPGICEWTCLSRTAVITALKALQGSGLVRIDKEIGKNNRCTIDLEMARVLAPANPCATRTSTPDAPVRDTHPTSTPDAPPPVRQTDYPRAPDAPEASISIIQASGKHQKARKRATLPRPDDVDPQTWEDWTALRKEKRATVSATVVNGARAEAAKASLTLERFLAIWCVRGSQGLQADWLKPHERGSNGPAPETPWEKRGRERMEEICPRIAAKAPNADEFFTNLAHGSETIEVEAKDVTARALGR